MPVTSQHKLDTNRAPRVQITYDVFTNGAKIQRELPFVVGIMADLSGKPEQPLPRLEEHEKRKFVEIDGANFDDIMAGAAPRLKFTVDNTLAEDGAPIDVVLRFEKLSDFAPDQVARQVEPLRKLLEERSRLWELLNKMESTPRFGDKLQEILGDEKSRNQLGSEIGEALGRPTSEKESE